MYELQASGRFRRDLKRCKRQRKDMEKFRKISVCLERGKALPIFNRDHNLTGNWQGCRECHIEPDWLLIYRIDETHKVIELVRIGSHSDLFG